MRLRNNKRYRPILCAAWLGIILLIVSGKSAIAEDVDALAAKLRHSNPEVRLYAVEALGKIRDSEALGELIGVIEDQTEDWTIKVRVVKLLGEIKNPRATGVLVKVLDDPSFTNNCAALKWNAAVALGNFKGHAKVIDALVDALEDRTLYVREAAIQSLGEIGNPDVAPYLIPMLNDESFAIRISAVRALGKIGAAEAIPHLKKLLSSDGDGYIKDEAARALKSLSARTSR
ncbi:MAG TPA: hypothetical protein DHV16_08500 [Nitrospiraceae bacterium]|nr:MAG: hypothetical protein A2Z82_03920 [Nitrospirae bacterium GWA2_46_11]OGW23425.1 MAG: hypothetical protein A2X55_01205 [Nitrospirae bacterium GWB2_47_37]HAK88991.1 hypothetical protein [Nitrospiraceae bacterium]HCZ12274.1 hypothetical protein [Nitrospiraceae bacterium]